MKLAKITAVSLLLLCALLCLGYWAVATAANTFTTREFVQADAQWRREFARVKSRIENDVSQLIENPIYTDRARLKNAEPVVRQFLTWEGDKSGSAPEGLEFENETKIKAFADRHSLKDLTPKSWRALLNDPELEQLKLSWLDDLISSDHFDMATHPSHQQAIEKAKTANGLEKIEISSQLPIPNFALLRAMATFRYAQLISKDKADEAAELFRHISHLIWTSNSLVGSMTAMSMLKFEHSLEETGAGFALPLVETERIEAMRSLSWFWGGTYRHLLLGDYFSPLKPYFTPETGACAGASESLAGTSGLEMFLGGESSWMEPDFTPAFKRVRKIEERLMHMCSMEAYKPFFESAPAKPSPLFVKNVYVVSDSLGDMQVPNPTLIPFVRRAAGATLLSIAMPNPFAVYDKRDREPASQ